VKRGEEVEEDEEEKEERREGVARVESQRVPAVTVLRKIVEGTTQCPLTQWRGSIHSGRRTSRGAPKQEMMSLLLDEEELDE